MKKKYKYSNTVVSGLDRDPPKLFRESVEIEPQDPEPQYPQWIKHYFWLLMGFVWGLLIIALLMDVL